MLPSIEWRNDGNSDVGRVNAGDFLGTGGTAGVFLVAGGTNVEDEADVNGELLLLDSA